LTAKPDWSEASSVVALSLAIATAAAVADLDAAAGDFLKTRDHAQTRRFPTPRGADQHDEFPVPRLDIDVANNFHRAE